MVQIQEIIYKCDEEVQINLDDKENQDKLDLLNSLLHTKNSMIAARMSKLGPEQAGILYASNPNLRLQKQWILITNSFSSSNEDKSCIDSTKNNNENQFRIPCIDPIYNPKIVTSNGGGNMKQFLSSPK